MSTACCWGCHLSLLFFNKGIHPIILGQQPSFKLHVFEGPGMQFEFAPQTREAAASTRPAPSASSLAFARLGRASATRCSKRCRAEAAGGWARLRSLPEVRNSELSHLFRGTTAGLLLGWIFRLYFVGGIKVFSTKPPKKLNFLQGVNSNQD